VVTSPHKNNKIMRIKLTETEKNRIRGLHKNFSIIKEQTEGVPCPGPECIHCLPCAKKALKGTNETPFIGGPYDYTNIADELIAEIMAIYATGITDPITLGAKLATLWLKYSMKFPKIMIDGPFIAMSLYNNDCEEAEFLEDGSENPNYGESLGTNAFGQCLPEEIFQNIPSLPYI